MIMGYLRGAFVLDIYTTYHRADAEGQRGSDGAGDPQGVGRLNFLPHNKAKNKAKLKFRIRKNPSKPCGSEGLIWWTIQDSKTNSYIS